MIILDRKPQGKENELILFLGSVAGAEGVGELGGITCEKRVLDRVCSRKCQGQLGRGTARHQRGDRTSSGAGRGML